MLWVLLVRGCRLFLGCWVEVVRRWGIDMNEKLRTVEDLILKNFMG
jgi:hypothetical protein